jgi:hypothetical protein
MPTKNYKLEMGSGAGKVPTRFFHPRFIIPSRASAFMQVLAMKHCSPKESPEHLWQQAQARAKKHAKKTGIPFHLWLLQAQNVLPFPSPHTSDAIEDLHRAFRDELLS